jgi:8-oxo-dGTP diphosphatase
MPGKLIHVAAGVVRNSLAQVLIAKRPDHVHQGGLWEFPGGKLEEGESAQAALKRELQEELNIQTKESRPLIRIRHDYADKSVLLDVWEVVGFTGEAQGNEGQAVRWVAPDGLLDYKFPAANTPIVNAVRLPDRMMITGSAPSREAFVKKVKMAIDGGVRCIQLRLLKHTEAEYLEIFQPVSILCEQAGVTLLANTSPALFERLHCQGLHINSRWLHELSERPVDESTWFSASCHNREEIAKAIVLGVDFITLSPLCATSTHPNAKPLGWDVFRQWCDSSNVPVYALGGLSLEDIEKAKGHGAQGIAAIREFWPVISV